MAKREIEPKSGQSGEISTQIVLPDFLAVYVIGQRDKAIYDRLKIFGIFTPRDFRELETVEWGLRSNLRVLMGRIANPLIALSPEQQEVLGTRLNSQFTFHHHRNTSATISSDHEVLKGTVDYLNSLAGDKP